MVNAKTEKKFIKSTKKVNTVATEKTYSVLKRPIITEKTTFVAEMGKLVFDVDMKATKIDIINAFSAIYGVEVVSVNTLIRKGKTKKFKGRDGVRSDVKKAYITLKAGTNIDVFANIK
ncbi:MAG: 50S ribosomal protein L23 [Rickettsiales bacterium]|nr:50S ribosomal protein L23 [Rickettsiales bacterium]